TEVLIGKDPLDRYLSCGHTMDDAMPSVFHIDEIELVDVNVRGDWSEETVTQGTKPETSVTTEDPTPNYYNKIWNGKIDPYRICRLFDVGGGPREQIVKKGLRGTSKGQTEADLIKELKKAMDRWVEMAIEDGILTGDEPWI
ncbi:MAG: hypothetical protein OEX12_08930, partial [Gammaproteobacteria bacterium]|nr:hypothetical protein [Gammaproteobacteria bacterium]